MGFDEFDGDYFVCFLDISGFKSLMKDGLDIAKEALLFFYDCGYQTLRKIYGIEGIFISDCAILASKRSDSKINEIKKLLLAVKEINLKMLDKNYLMTCSIAYGQFYFKDLNAYSGVEKLPVYGEAYLNAFLDNESQNPKLEPGFLRIVKKGLPLEVFKYFSEENNKYVERIGVIEESPIHFYVHWMLNTNLISDIKKEYKIAKEYPYSAYRLILKKYAKNLD